MNDIKRQAKVIKNLEKHNNLISLENKDFQSKIDDLQKTLHDNNNLLKSY